MKWLDPSGFLNIVAYDDSDDAMRGAAVEMQLFSSWMDVYVIRNSIYPSAFDFFKDLNSVSLTYSGIDRFMLITHGNSYGIHLVANRVGFTSDDLIDFAQPYTLGHVSCGGVVNQWLFNPNGIAIFYACETDTSGIPKTFNNLVKVTTMGTVGNTSLDVGLDWNGVRLFRFWSRNPLTEIRKNAADWRTYKSTYFLPY